MSGVSSKNQLLTPELLIRAYSVGIFPMSHSRNDPSIFWVDPKMRGILPLNSFHISHSLKKTVRKGKFKVSFNTDFHEVIVACAETPRADTGTWINDQIINAFTELHQLGLAHSVECRLNGMLVGGLYGISINGLFCGESMFSVATDASKVALVHLVARLKQCQLCLLDIQFVTDHLKVFGAVEIPTQNYMEHLQQALQSKAKFEGNLPENESRLALEQLLIA
tara:strand:+ start:771 stop:1439 length:669 start_codon:yes stop_codon:yes gene_type:complete